MAVNLENIGFLSYQIRFQKFLKKFSLNIAVLTASGSLTLSEIAVGVRAESMKPPCCPGHLIGGVQELEKRFQEWCAVAIRSKLVITIQDDIVWPL